MKMNWFITVLSSVALAKEEANSTVLIMGAGTR
jgi:hypothetical protein